MMRTHYNPFERPDIIHTSHGTINFTHPLGSVYVTRREGSKAFFKKFQGFGISNTELRVCDKELVKWVLINYKNPETNTERLYRISLKDVYNRGEDYTHYSDSQKVVPLALMQEYNADEGQWQSAD